MNRTELISEGKTKRLWATDDPKTIVVEFSDDAMMYHAKKKQYFPGKGAYCNKINAILMQVLQENNIPTHFIAVDSDNSIAVRKADMLPIEVVVRNYAAGSMVDRLGLQYHSKLKFPVLELCYKNDALDDPVINEYHALAMSLCTQEEMTFMMYTATRINKVLCDLMRQIGIIVADFKVEFGRLGTSRLVVADEITPNVARFWDQNTLNRFDDEGRQPDLEYKEILKRLREVTDYNV